MSYILQMDKLGQTLNNCKQHAAKTGIRAEICKTKLFKKYLLFKYFSFPKYKGEGQYIIKAKESKILFCY